MCIGIKNFGERACLRLFLFLIAPLERWSAVTATKTCSEERWLERRLKQGYEVPISLSLMYTGGDRELLQLAPAEKSVTIDGACRHSLLENDLLVAACDPAMTATTDPRHCGW